MNTALTHEPLVAEGGRRCEYAINEVLRESNFRAEALADTREEGLREAVAALPDWQRRSADSISKIAVLALLDGEPRRYTLTDRCGLLSEEHIPPGAWIVTVIREDEVEPDVFRCESKAVATALVRGLHEASALHLLAEVHSPARVVTEDTLGSAVAEYVEEVD